MLLCGGETSRSLWERACARQVLGVAQQSPASGLLQEQVRHRALCGSALARDGCWVLLNGRLQAASHNSKCGIALFVGARLRATGAGHCPTVARKRPPTRAGAASCSLWERACARRVLGVAQRSPASGLLQQQVRHRALCGSALARDGCWVLLNSRPQAASHNSKCGIVLFAGARLRATGAAVCVKSSHQLLIMASTALPFAGMRRWALMGESCVIWGVSPT